MQLLSLNDRYANYEDLLTTRCACGCGAPCQWHLHRGRLRKSLRGHRGLNQRERLLAKTAVDLDGPRHVDDSPCWIWTGSAVKGYGQIKNGDQMVLAHRLAYEIWFGPIPGSPIGGLRGDGLEIDHLCRQSMCINPAHLEPVDDLENARRKTVARRQDAGWRCRAGHDLRSDSERTRDGGCRICARDYQRAWREANRDRIRQRWREWDARRKAVSNA